MLFMMLYTGRYSLCGVAHQKCYSRPYFSVFGKTHFTHSWLCGTEKLVIMYKCCYKAAFIVRFSREIKSTLEYCNVWVTTFLLKAPSHQIRSA
jgi:hypothetical protein